ncbi:ras-related protein Rab-18 [Drosophila sulfurigaster albostrigata]|uniref:Ras-related protein Rab-18 n=1 Tax=Drosophila albomicans TaxID=7291 RepID=A0A6P8X447_DROAB|nr:ras-related protein Rab-18 [Drosophila albomicans]XP_060662351.1 ras-related protein Rab-18 [Drosophila nasuta]XP_062138704.1 ras-related protein Rab-18 [Drosophila sulfurigaster albostrigata]
MADRAIKLLIIGESGVGKSSLVRRFVENKFDENHDVTIGMDFKSAVMNVDGIDYKVALWDTAGAERFRSLTPSFYRKALGAILVYDITDRDSLVKLEAWLAEVDSFSDNPNIAIIVVGNKIDKDRVVDREEGRKFARKHRALFIETSAKCDQFVSDAFRDIVEKIVSSEYFGSGTGASNGMTIDNTQDVDAAGSTCYC